MFSVNSMATNWPREVCSAVSVAQTGVIAFRIPVPIPLKIRAVLFSRLEVQCQQPSHTADHPRMVLRRALKTSPDNCPNGRDGDRVDATEFVADVATEEGTKEGTGQIVYRDLKTSARTAGPKAATHNASLECRSVDHDRLGSGVVVAKVHDVDVASRSVYSSHDSLIIAKEEDGKGSDAVDGDQQGSLFKAVDEVKF